MPKKGKIRGTYKATQVTDIERVTDDIKVLMKKNKRQRMAKQSIDLRAVFYRINMTYLIPLQCHLLL